MSLMKSLAYICAGNYSQENAANVLLYFYMSTKQSLLSMNNTVK